MDTGDKSQDFADPFGQKITMCYASSEGSANFVFHYIYGFFALEFNQPPTKLSVNNRNGKKEPILSFPLISSIDTVVTIDDSKKKFWKRHGE